MRGGSRLALVVPAVESFVRRSRSAWRRRLRYEMNTAHPIERLESRRLLTSLSGDDLANAWYVRRNPDDPEHVQVYDGDAPIAGQIAYDGLEAVTIGGAGGDDRLTVDYSYGSPVPSGGLSFDGDTGNDVLIVVGTSGNDDFIISLTGVQLGTASFTHANVEEVSVNGLTGTNTITCTDSAVRLRYLSPFSIVQGSFTSLNGISSFAGGDCGQA